MNRFVEIWAVIKFLAGGIRGWELDVLVSMPNATLGMLFLLLVYFVVRVLKTVLWKGRVNLTEFMHVNRTSLFY